jgi:hypothetical protein
MFTRMAGPVAAAGVTAIVAIIVAAIVIAVGAPTVMPAQAGIHGFTCGTKARRGYRHGPA